MGVGVERLAEADAAQLEADAAPGAAALEQQQVAAVGVDVEQVGVERADAQRPVSHAAAPPRSRRGRRSRPRGGRRRARGRRRRPRRAAPRRSRAASAIAFGSVGALARRARSCAGAARSACPPLTSRTAVGCDTKRQPSTSAASGVRQLDVVARTRSSISAIASATRPPGATARRAEAKNPRRSSSSWIVCIGTATSANAASPASKPAASATRVRTGSPPARSRSTASSSASMSSAVTSCPARASSSATRPVPAPTSSTGPPASSRELAPQRQVGPVVAALDVVPDHVGVHRQYSSAWPRRASRSRSSSSAV